jgi:hypothetical protein
VQRSGRARREADFDHGASVSSAVRWSPGSPEYSFKTASPPLPTSSVDGSGGTDATDRP